MGGGHGAKGPNENHRMREWGVEVGNTSIAAARTDASVVLIPETTIRGVGEGPILSVAQRRTGVLNMSLGILRGSENESLRIAIWGSADGKDWGPEPLMSFSRKFYCGTYSGFLDISGRPEIRYLRAAWNVKRWGKENSVPSFTVQLCIAEAEERQTSHCA